MNHHYRVAGMLALCLCVAPAGANAGGLVAVSGDGATRPESLYTLGRKDASLSFAGALGNGDDGESIVFNPVDGRLYHFSGEGAVSELGDPATGAVFESVGSGRGGNPRAVAFSGLTGADPATSAEAFAAAYDLSSGGFLVADSRGHLYRVGPAGAVRVLGELGFQVKGLAFRRNTLYAIEQRDSFDVDGETDLIVLDPATGAVLSSVNLSLDGASLEGNNANGLAVDPETGEVYAIVQTGTGRRLLVVIDPRTGAATRVGAVGESIAAITFLGLFGIAEMFEDSLSGAGAAPLAAGRQLVALPLHGAHERPLLAQPELGANGCFWVHGDFAGVGRDSDADLYLAEVGLCGDLVPERLRVGLGIGRSAARQDLAFGGASDLDGQYLYGEVDFRAGPLPLIWSLGLLYGGWDADVERAYPVFGGRDRSAGRTSVRSAAARLRVDWLHAFTLGGAAFTPRAEATLSRVSSDAYDEAGGAFPVRFDSRSATSGEVRLGFDVELPVGADTRVLGLLEGVHRFHPDAPPDVEGTIIGQPFSFRTGDTTETWGRAGLGLAQRLGQGATFVANVITSTRGGDPELSAGAGLRIRF